MSKQKVAICTGVNGQDGSFLSELLLSKGYKVIGVSRRSTRENNNLEECISNSNFVLEIMDITDASGVQQLIRDYQPDEFYNLAAMSHVGQSFKEPLATLDIDGKAVVSILEGIRSFAPECRFYQASTSEMFGEIGSEDKLYGLHEESVFNPKSPYAAAKIYAHNMVGMYRIGYDLHASCGILFNHESFRRGKDFVTRKITYNIALIKTGIKKDKLKMGPLTTSRDFGAAQDYVEAMWLMLQKDKPDDYVIATGECICIQKVLEYVCELAELDWQDIYELDVRFVRPIDVKVLKGCSDKARRELKWIPRYSWKDILHEMYEYDLRLVDRLLNRSVQVGV